MRAEDDFIPCRHERCKDETLHPAHDADFGPREPAPKKPRFVNRAGRAGGAFIYDVSGGPKIKRMTVDMHAIVECPQCKGKKYILEKRNMCTFCWGEGECTLIRWHYFKSRP